MTTKIKSYVIRYEQQLLVHVAVMHMPVKKSEFLLNNIVVKRSCTIIILCTQNLIDLVAVNADPVKFQFLVPSILNI
jgi:hypothetical protein